MPDSKHVTQKEFDNLAQMTEREFTAVHAEMRDGFARVHEDLGILRRDMEVGFHEVAEVLKLIREDLREFKTDTDTELQNLRARLDRLEKKVGLSK